MNARDPLVIAGRAFGSRLMIGTGKYATFEIMRDAHRRSGAEVVTVAVRRVNLADRSAGSLMDFIDLNRMLLLPNTAACYTAEEAIRTARLGRELLDTPWVKLEVIGDEKTLFPDNAGLVEATKVLAKEGFIILPYFNDDLITARRLVDAGAAAIMPLAAPIGSGLGIQNFTTMRILREMITEVPIIVDAGVGNTAVAAAQDPGAMAEAMKLGVQAGRLAYLAGRMPKRLYASASSPLEGVSPLAAGRP
jgi:thiazole synthase